MRGNRAAAILTGVGVVVLAGFGFTLSFDALRDLAERSGIPAALAPIWPLTVDGFIVIATAATLTLSSGGKRVTWYPWAALILFATVSVTGNALHAINQEDQLGVAVPIAVAVNSIPAIALLVASHLLVVMIRNWTRTAATTSATKRDTAAAMNSVAATTSATPYSSQTKAPVAAMQFASASLPASASTVAVRSVAGPGEQTAPGTLNDVPQASVAALTKAERITVLSRELAGGQTLTGASVAERFGLSERTARRDLAEAKDLSTSLVVAA